MARQIAKDSGYVWLLRIRVTHITEQPADKN